MNTKKVVVTGGHGFLGRFVCDELRSYGYDVATFGSRNYNLVDPYQTLEMFVDLKPNIVVHLAARVGGIGANKNNPGKFAYENLTMGVNVLESAKRYHVDKVVTTGTICSYPKHTPVPFKEDDIWNGYPEETNAPYGVAKKAVMVMGQGYRQQYGCNFVFLLPVNMYGPNDNFHLENSHVIPAMIRKFHEAKVNGIQSVTLWGDGSPTREFLFVGDCARAIRKTVQRYNGGDPINIGTGKEISMLNLATQVKKVVEYEGDILWDTTRPNGQPRRCLDVSRAKRVLDWEAEVDLEEGLMRTYEWFKNNGEKS